MKKLTLAILTAGALALGGAQAVDFYYQGSGSVTDLSNWNSQRDGSGSAPANFTTAGNRFIIQDTQTATASATWTVSGAGSGVLIETGGAMTSGAFNHSITLSMEANGSYTMDHTSYGGLSFGTVNSNSNFVVGGAGTSFRDVLTYGNATWNSSGNVTPGNVITTGNFTVSSSEVRGSTGSTSRTWAIGANLNIGASGTFRLNNSTGASTVLNIGGGLTNDGTLLRGSVGASSAAINFTGTGASSVKWGTHTGPFDVSIGANKTITFTDSLNTSNGNVVVAGGLVIDSASTVNVGTASLTVNEGGMLSGSGGVIGSVVVDGGFAPGTSPGTFNVTGNFTLTGTSDSTFEIDGITAGLYDVLDVSGMLTLGGQLTLVTNYAANLGDTIQILNWGTIGGNFSQILGTNIGGGLSWDVSNLATSGTITVVPEPNTVLLFGLGAAFLLWRMRRRLAA